MSSQPHRSRFTRVGTRVRPPAWIAWCALIALTWSSLGILPSIALEIAARQAVATHRHDDGRAAGGAAHEHHAHGSDHDAQHGKGDFSEIPGSPTHPLDHDCVQCQVLAQLARCIVDAACASGLDVVPGRPIRPFVAIVARAARDVAYVPPARGPPFHSA